MECVLKTTPATVLLVMGGTHCTEKGTHLATVTEFVYFRCNYVQTIVFSECEENPCQNGGTCQRHVLDYHCQCPPSTSGDFCENIITTSTYTVQLSIVIVFVNDVPWY